MVSCHVEKKAAVSLASVKDSTPTAEIVVKPNPEILPLIEAPKVQEKTVLGVEVLQQIDFDILQGKRVGLVTNPTGVDSHLKSTIDIFHDSDKVNLVALFSPEHGVRGNFSAGDFIENQTDPKTGVPVFSLYGKSKRPNKAAMDRVDVLVYDIQDIGVRSYTYISTMGMIMEVAAEYGKEVIVLDRPNPLSGERVEGSLVEDGYFSFVSQFKIPYIYGLTCGELARLINYEGMLRNGKQCNLQVVPMQNWTRSTTYNKTGLIWVPTSPHIPNWESAFYYAATGILGELNPNYIGIGYTLPFQTLVTSDIDARLLCNALNELKLEGVQFRPIYYKPYYKDKVGVELQGAQIHITDFSAVNLTEIQFYFIQVASKLNPKFNAFKVDAQTQKMFDIVCGTPSIRKALTIDPNFDKIKALWNTDVETFRKLSEKYYLYE
jgi:uncharacterized protein YbbC (DUF1343 family)